MNKNDRVKLGLDNIIVIKQSEVLIYLVVCSGTMLIQYCATWW